MLDPKPWHGNLVAMIRRAIIALGTARVDKWPKKPYSDLLDVFKTGTCGATSGAFYGGGGCRYPDGGWDASQNSQI
jgi:hypothetical protein